MNLFQTLTYVTLLALFPATLHAQTPAPSPTPDQAASVEEKPKPRSSHEDVKRYETELKTTDCSRMPTRTLLSDCTQMHYQTRVVDLNNADTQQDANEILVSVRNMFDPAMKVYLISSQNVIVVGSYPEELARVEAFIHALDRPHKTYRLTYTLSDFDNGKRVGTQHYTMLVINGQRTTMKQGDKVPVVTGSYSPDKDPSKTQTQIQYLDVGMNFIATLDEFSNGGRLSTKIEQSSVAESKSIADVTEPVIRQTVLEGTAFLIPGKPLTLGTLDITGTPRHIEISVLMELVS